MHTMNPNVLRNLIWQMAPYNTEESVTIPEWVSYTGVHTAPGEIVLNGDEKTVMKLGDHWFVGYDDTRYFEACVKIPESFEGRTVRLVIDFGGEALVRINGELSGAVSSRENSGWVGRNDIIFNRDLKGGEELFIQLEAAVDSAAFCDHSIAGESAMEYTLKEASLVLINDDAEGFYTDLTCAFDVYLHSEDKYVAKRLYNITDTAIHMLSFDLGKKAYYDSIKPAREYFNKECEALSALSKTPGEVILAGHSHLDVAWLWTVKEIHRKTARTFSNNIELLKKYPSFNFTQSQAVLYDFMKKHYPDIFEQIKKYVKEGRWEIIGNTWVEADTNLASGESLIRQLLYGREFFLKEFGVSSDTYWLPDCFGFTAALPQIIKKSGMKYFITSKLQYNDTNEFPLSVFKWRSHSGDEVLAYMQKVHYEGEGNAEYIVKTRSTNRQNDVVDASMGMFGYGDGGGGCTFNMVERVNRFAKLPGLAKVRIGKASEFFAEVEKSRDELPVWDGEMYYENHRGTFTSQAFIKKNNRKGEYMLRNAEILGLLSGTYDKNALEKAWKLLLINQFHDILPGTSIHEAIENTREEYGELRKLGHALISDSLNVLNKKAGIGKLSVVVWNPSSHTVSNAVEVRVPAEITAVSDANGSIIKSAFGHLENGEKLLTFIADGVPGMGYKVYSLSSEEKGAEFPSVTAEKNLLENEYLRVTLNENGALTSVFDKENNREVLSGKGNVLTISHDKPVHESAWNLENDYMMNMTELDESESVTVLEASPVRGVIEVIKKYHDSTVTQKIILKAGSKTLDFDTEVDWHEREKVLKAEFPVNIRARFSTFEIAHGALQRPTYANNSYEKAMFECCAHKWTDLSEGDYGVSLLNDCKYGYDIQSNVMRITLMRGPICPDPKGDLGKSSFVYSLYPHAGGWSEAGTVGEAFKLNLPISAFTVIDGKGEKHEHAFFALDKENIIIDAVKKAQNDNGIIIRVYEAEGKHTTSTLSFPFSVRNVIECNMMEQPEDEKVLTFGENSVTFDISPFEVKTFRLILK